MKKLFLLTLFFIDVSAVEAQPVMGVPVRNYNYNQRAGFNNDGEGILGQIAAEFVLTMVSSIADVIGQKTGLTLADVLRIEVSAIIINEALGITMKWSFGNKYFQVIFGGGTGLNFNFTERTFTNSFFFADLGARIRLPINKKFAISCAVSPCFFACQNDDYGPNDEGKTGLKTQLNLEFTNRILAYGGYIFSRHDKVFVGIQYRFPFKKMVAAKDNSSLNKEAPLQPPLQA